MRRLAIAVAAMFVAATAGAQMYRWVDKDGKVHYTDTPPPAASKSVQKRATAPARPNRSRRAVRGPAGREELPGRRLHLAELRTAVHRREGVARRARGALPGDRGRPDSGMSQRN